jgi:hypothetical protein
LKDGIILYLKDVYRIENPKTVVEKHLDEAIGYLRGFDPRTIKNWKKLLMQHEYIRKTGNHQYELL